MQITSSEVFKLIGDIAIARISRGRRSQSVALREAHTAVERYLGVEIEFKIKLERPTSS